MFATDIEFVSEEEDWDVNNMIATGFRTYKQQQRYILELRLADAAHFGDLSGMSLEVEGELVTETATDELQPPGNTDNTTWIYIIVACGVVVLVFAPSIIIYRKRHPHNRRSEKNAYDLPFKVQSVAVDHERGSALQTDNDTYADPTHQSYFGTIQQSEYDDVSTLGDPYMGDVPAISTPTDDPTVGGSTLVSKQDQLFTYGLRPRVGTDLESRMGNTTVTGSKAMLFGEDLALEEIYHTPVGVGEGPPALDFITVVAPAGRLGIVLNNPSDDFPIVYAVKDTSVLNGSVQVGDLLVSVDEVECRGMSSRTISSFLSSRSQNPTRTLVLARGSVDV